MLIDFQQGTVIEPIVNFPDWAYGSLPAGTGETYGQGTPLQDHEIFSATNVNTISITGSVEGGQAQC